MHRESIRADLRRPTNFSVPYGRRRAVCLACLLAVCLSPATLRAAVLESGDVWPADDLFTPLVDEGLPVDGNFIDPFEPPDMQTNYEVPANICVGGANDTFCPVTNPETYVPGLGIVLVSGESQLNYQNLVIGDAVTTGMGVNQGVLLGTGIFRIDGFGSAFSNDPTKLPTGVPSNFASVDPRDPDVGFDLYVGRAGTGTMSITNGGRAEIQDAIFIGDEIVFGTGTGTRILGTGLLQVDGPNTFLSSGGFMDDMSDLHEFYIGRKGYGELQITNGAQVVTRSPVPTTPVGTNFVYSVSLGGELPDQDIPPGSLPDTSGGTGIAVVDGDTGGQLPQLPTQWLVADGMQLGSFHDTRDPATPGVEHSDIDGNEVMYDSNIGQGTLTIADGGLVRIFPSTDVTSVIRQYVMVIGRAGRLEFDDGDLVMLGDPETTQQALLLISDGVISGDGEIDTGIFRNRLLGEVRVAAGQKLSIDTHFQVDVSGYDNPDQAPMNNWGLFEIIGTHDNRAELETERSPLVDPSSEVVQPFFNRALAMGTTMPISRTAGLIHAQHATLRFRSGLSNQGTVAFTSGVNIVSGDVTNEAVVPAMFPEGVILLSGETHVTFEDDLTNNGTLDIEAGSTATVLGDSTFTMGPMGTFSIEVGDMVPGALVATGDIELDGTLVAELSGFAPPVGSSFDILAAGGELTGLFVNQILPTSFIPDTVWSVLYDDLADTVSLALLSTAGVIGGDFNGDGIVNGLDAAIWAMNAGIMMGATPLQGDANGDGAVNLADWQIWNDQMGGPGMAPGAGAGAAAGFAAVPEPASLSLALFAMAVLLGSRRRKQ